MAEIKPKYYEDEEYDICGNTTIATLSVNHIKIPLCRKCLDELLESVEKFKNTIFCHQCDHFIMSSSGWNYGGSCKKKAELDGKEITYKDAGYSYCVGCMDTCQYASKFVYKIYADDCGNQPCSGSCEVCNDAYWKYQKVPFHYSYNSEINKSIFLTEEDAKRKCNELMNRKVD